MSTTEVNFVHTEKKNLPNRKHKLERLHSQERERGKHSIYTPKQGGIKSTCGSKRWKLQSRFKGLLKNRR